jgi:hypothetical protein
MASQKATFDDSIRYISFTVQRVIPLSDAADEKLVSPDVIRQLSGTNWHGAMLDIVGTDKPTFALIRLNAYPSESAKLEGGIRKQESNLWIVEWDTAENNLCLRVQDGGYSAGLEDRRKLEDGC